MPSIKEDLSAISKEINDINREAKEAALSTKSLGNELKLDPKNLEIIKQRYKSLGNELDLNTKKIAAMQKAQAQLERLRVSSPYKDDEEALKKINAQIDDYRVKIQYAIDKQKQLKILTDETKQNQTLISAAIANANEQWAKSEKTARKVQVAAVAILAALTKITKAAVDQGTELYSLSKRYETTADDLQLWNRALQLATGQADLFTNSLSVLSKGISDVATKRGVAFNNALKAIGVSFKDIENLTRGEQFQTILEGLKNIENQSTRAAYAQRLLGESGQYIAQVLDDIDIDEYLEQAQKFGIISQNNAKRLAELGFELEAVKSSLAVAGAELVTSLAPTIEFIGNFLKTIVVPVLNGISKTLNALGVFGGVLLTIGFAAALLLPKLILLMKLHTIQTNLATVATKALGKAAVATQVAMGPWGLIIAAVGAALTGLMAIIGATTEKNNELNDSLAETAENFGLIGTQTQANIESTSTTMRTQTIDITVDISGSGDTAISDEAAVMVAQLTAEQINKTLGEKIK